ncbi:MAG: HIT family hydrolase [Planctomycetaceae bacterium]|jgi:ATP adenylyltransferase|nr:HIT family hydrolase [Planctomycetaceae bacterium]MDP7276390.1 HIT domain-containing protein [Planctomycetaceae bacterium]
MTGQSLWAPWRLDYIVTSDNDDGCFLCRYRDADPTDDSRQLVIARGEHTMTMLNRFPYNNGHLLVAPREHVGDLVDLDPAVVTECVEQLQHWTRRLRETMAPHGFNIGLNLGRVAGAGLPGHLHWHIVPRWEGDTNFMPVLGNPSVIPQSLDSLFELLTADQPPDEVTGGFPPDPPL